MEGYSVSDGILRDDVKGSGATVKLFIVQDSWRNERLGVMGNFPVAQAESGLGANGMDGGVRQRYIHKGAATLSTLCVIGALLVPPGHRSAH
jgi:hypothetical protein